jgi:hypothetical protein
LYNKLPPDIGEDDFFLRDRISAPCCTVNHCRGMTTLIRPLATAHGSSLSRLAEKTKRLLASSPGVTLHCEGWQWDFIKIWIQGTTLVKSNPPLFNYWFPFVDVFFLDENSTRFYERRGWKRGEE